MRKPLRLFTLLASLLPTLALAAPTPMRLHESYACTDVINVGANTIGALSTAGGGQGTLVVSGLSGTVSKAWLYWKGIPRATVRGALHFRLTTSVAALS